MKRPKNVPEKQPTFLMNKLTRSSPLCQLFVLSLFEAFPQFQQIAGLLLGPNISLSEICTLNIKIEVGINVARAIIFIYFSGPFGGE